MLDINHDIQQLLSNTNAQVDQQWCLNAMKQYPYFTLPALLYLQRNGNAAAKDNKELLARLAIASADRRSLYNVLGENADIFASFYPPQEENTTPTTENTIDTFLNTFGNSSEKELEVLNNLIFSPVPDYADILAAEEQQSMPQQGEATSKNDDFEFTGETEDRYETEVEVKVKKVKHKFYVYRCTECGQIVICRTQPEKRTKSRYGANVQALILFLINVMNSSMNKVPRFLEGVSNGEIKPCEGYVAKVQARAAKHLTEFHDDLRRRMLRQGLIYWDDTVVFADTKRICLRFYGDERIAFFVAHDHKDMEGLLKDGILENLSKETKVMHDHNRVNYNEKFVFQNLECIAHLQRQLQKIADETGHQILLKIKGMISSTIKDRKKLIEKGIEKFDDKYLSDFDEKLSEYISEAEKIAEANTSKYTGNDERALIRCIKEYRENYFAWVYDFKLPTTNNLSERSLRGVKTKMKVSGQFASSKTANYYALIRTYIETCRRNGINEYQALVRLCDDNPYTVDEIFSQN